MDEKQNENLTELIKDARNGGVIARDRLFRAIYEEFHQIAVALMSNERAGTLAAANGSGRRGGRSPDERSCDREGPQ